MSDLIDRQAAIAYAISGRVRTLPTSEDGEDWIRTEEVRQSLSTMPSAEPEIVRCKDCKYYNPIGVCIEMSSAVCEDSFCCWAERRTDELSD